MDFTNTFAVQAPLQRVWEFLLDAQEVAPCVPGAELTDTVSETQYRGTVRVKLGAVQVQYRGELQVEPDEENRTITLRAKGTEIRGSGGATGTATARLAEQGDGMTQVTIESHVDVTGRVAQFGRGIMQDVANRLIREFARCLEQKLQPRRGASVEAGSGGGPVVTATEAAEGSLELSPTSTGAPTVSPPDSQPAVAPASAEQAPPSSHTEQPAKELELLPVLAAVARARLAAGLRRLASLIEPK